MTITFFYLYYSTSQHSWKWDHIWLWQFFSIIVCACVCSSVCGRVCLIVRECTCTCSKHAVLFVPCSYSSCHCISLFSYLFCVCFSLSLPLFFFASFYFLSIYWRCCSFLSQCPAHLCDITAGSVQSDQLLVKGVNETLVAQRVVPALITLSSDPEM